MKISEILEKTDLNKNECNVCSLYDAASELIDDNDAIRCAHCNNPLFEEGNFKYFTTLMLEDVIVVGESNSVDKNEKIRKYYTSECILCRGYTSFVPTKIMYNANHDIYYTGGRKYTSSKKKLFSEEIKKKIMLSIEQYTTRIQNGEDNLKPCNLMTWIKYDLEEVCSEFLYDNGLKI